MAKTLVHRNLGPRSTPQDIKDLRNSSFDYHETYGQPVIFKHRWNEQDLRAGFTERCPYAEDDVYQEDHSWDPYCFGTGYLGGYADPQILYVTFSDAPQNVIKFGPSGGLYHEEHPLLTAPWLPELGDGDLIITGNFDPITMEIYDTSTRYLIHGVNPVTIRGVKQKIYKVHQEAQGDRLQYGDSLYEVPINFDYSNLPNTPEYPPDYDPGDFPAGSQFASMEIGARVIGAPKHLLTSTEREVRLATSPGSSTSRDVRLVGQGEVVWHNL